MTCGAQNANTPERSYKGVGSLPMPCPLKRSLTDSHIQYPHEELSEAAGSANFVRKDGTLNYNVILLVSGLKRPKKELH